MSKSEIGELRATAFNNNWPIGTSVDVVTDSGLIIETKTASEAWALGSGDVLIKLEGKSGGYDLSRVFPKGEQ